VSSLLDRLAPDSRVAIIRLRSLGDCVLTTPAISLLKAFRPDLNIGVVVEDHFAAVFRGNPDVHSILSPSVGSIGRWGAALTLNLHGGSTSSQLTFAARSRWRAGFDHFRFRALYNVHIPRAQQILGVERKVHTAEHLASAMFYLGVPRRDIPQARLYAVGPSLPRPYVVIHPMASAPDKTWSADRFLSVAEQLSDDLEPIFISGPGEKLDIFKQFRCMSGADLEQVISLMAGATLFIGNDSGPAHMAAAFGVPVVVLFGSSDPVIWAPWKTESEVLTSNEGIAAITTEQVIAAAAKLMARV
jgi:ADP-heptose:LPS heptosyltransferase